MPALRSPKHAAKVTAPRRSIWPWVLIAACAALAVVAASLPASLITHFLPPNVRAEDFSGSIWHGSTGKITVSERPAGALEWWLHPPAVLRMTVAADLHWVKQGFVIDSAAQFDRHGFSANKIEGGGPIEDLHDFGLAAVWSGTANLKFSELQGDFAKLSAAVGDISVANLTSSQVGNGADWGGYELHLGQGAIAADGSVSADLNDTGGPLQAQAHIHLSPSAHTGLLTGTLKERPEAAPDIRSQLDSLSQLRGRDAEGRIAVDLEFTF